ncbi:acetyl-CoA carboxylase biotin carboxyl carrier protein subunit [Ammoniphilus sp. 3BR4]|uniref:acetyl-CoA carboxylase biotin carboxyl carrier protein n=1 Tax=Ammoniphilus sp. 3BR4 TaxID=3158265 RepID=UPI0034658494
MSKNGWDLFTDNQVKNIIELIQKLDESSFDFLKLENQDLKIVIGKNGVVESNDVQGRNEQPVTPNNVIPISTIESHLDEAAATVEPVIREAAPVKEAAKEQEGIITIKALTAGLFYAQPEPGAAPYVKVGDRVEKDTTVGLIEIMKVYSALTAGVSGEIVDIHVQDAQLVEYGQPLFSVKVN